MFKKNINIKIKTKILNLRKKIEMWNNNYYVKNLSLVSDEKYDSTLFELNELEKKYSMFLNTSYSNKIVAKNICNKFKKIKHLSNMLSLESIFNYKNLLNFHEKVKKNLFYNEKRYYCCELKIDGLAINLIYKNGILDSASTRGDGLQGEDVTKNALEIKSIPHILKKNNLSFPKKIEIRGEVFIKLSTFNKINKMLKSKRKKLFSNARNMASGSLRQINPKITKNRSLSFYGYGIGYVNEKKYYYDQHDALKLINSWGIPIEKNTELCKSLNEVKNFYEKSIKIRDYLDFNIDGIVVKVNSMKLQKKLGCSSKYPRWAIAYKFSSEEKCTKILGVNFNVGRTGVITPVAKLKPVYFMGTIIKYSSLHNKDIIDKLGIMINDTVCLKKSGDVIPKISRVIFEKRKNVKEIIFPKTCIFCKSKIEFCLRKKNLYCTGGFLCYAQRKQLLNHFVSREALNIKGMGNKIISQLIEKKIIKYPSDIFKLNTDKIIFLKGMGLKSSENLIKEIIKSKTTELYRVIYGIGIPNVGIYTSMNLANYYKNISNFINTSYEDLRSIKGIGSFTSNCIKKFLKDKRNISIISDLLNVNLKIK
ncbi:lig [Wigglesworthia glossinidia endosymbiont of Glossina brevipalpis]|uniref:DNA ligase n=1 Tax=Wigglesworthia glossinidia brevipalpis TaxID=36870 RepID=DNLJ_WIGBR|nr:RecName: Full=DNA ligase; AltName: Full=Polydeoxyribonucleotide synthase [NAD(+)] [Wigglesworthia glossinidia endosymbiont of Glossina brevipalpis]BAC24581.1 lig [Wigglesworthia glossinidia endosymbiont of Glossina brevipalpis]